jgi:hypothetical protein
MNCVSLVCTVHEEQGLANVSELRAILERIRPEVIFLEVPPAAFDDYYEICNQRNLESNAVRQYRESHQVELVPVDLPTPEREFFEDHEYFCIRIRQTSPEYRQLISWDRVHVRAYGFAYLNSDHCGKLWSDVYKEMLSTIKRIGDSRLVEIYESWKKTIDLREKEMMENIQKYCRENTFDRSVFLVGAAHRQRIIDKLREQSAIDSSRIQWNFPSCLSQTTREVHNKIVNPADA